MADEDKGSTGPASHGTPSDGAAAHGSAAHGADPQSEAHQAATPKPVAAEAETAEVETAEGVASEQRGALVPEPTAPAAVRPAPLHPRTFSEWTASDRRGPLETADEEIERFVPAHEMDAEGGLDPAAQAPSDPVTTPSEEGTPRASAAATPAPSSTGHGERPRSMVPVAAGLVVGAIIGAGSAWLVYSQAPADSGDAQRITALSSRIDALDKKPDAPPALTKLQSDLSALQGQVAALAKPAASGGPNGPSSPAAAPDSTLAAKVAALATTVDALKARTMASPATGGESGKAAALLSGLAEVRKQAADAQSGLDGVRGGQKQLGDRLAEMSAALAGAQKQAQSAQAGIESVETRQKVLDAKLGSPALAVVADSLVQQIVAGRPFAHQVDALAALAADPAKIAILRENAGQGVPSAKALLAGWKPLEDPVIATGNKAPADANFGQRLEHGLFGLVSVRRSDGTGGDDLASRVGLIATDLATGDVAGAFDAWQALPPDARARSASWGAQAKTAAAALAAARDLELQAIDALGAKKS